MESSPQTQAPRTRKRMTRQEREEQILSVAERRFAERGYYGVSMDAIADEVGLSKQMVYNYVGSKEALYLACFRRAREELQTALDAGLADRTDPEEQLWHGLLACLGFVEENERLWSILNEQASARGGPFASEITAARAETARLIAQLLSDAREARGARSGVDTETAAFTVVGAVEGMVNWWLDNPKVKREFVAERLMDVLWMGLDNLLSDRSWEGLEG